MEESEGNQAIPIPECDETVLEPSPVTGCVPRERRPSEILTFSVNSSADLKRNRGSVVPFLPMFERQMWRSQMWRSRPVQQGERITAERTDAEPIGGRKGIYSTAVTVFIHPCWEEHAGGPPIEMQGVA